MGGDWKGSIKFEVIKTKDGSGIKWDLPLIKIDFIPSILHYRVTAGILALFSWTIGICQFYGNPIQCNPGEDDDPLNEVAETYCWIHSTYTVPSNLNLMPHPGIAPIRLPLNPGEVKSHKYYIWVSLVLFAQALLFYLPRYIWKTCEDGKVRMMTTGLLNVLNASDSEKTITELKTYFRAHVGFNQYYFASFLFSEGLNFLNVIAQAIFLDYFLGNEFTSYGIKVIGFIGQHPETRVDGIEAVFPKMTKCTFETHGPSGGRISHDFLCLLPINIFNEKIFIFIWGWFLMLTVINTMSIIFWMVYVVSPYWRLKLLLYPHIRRTMHINIFKTLPIGDIFLIYQVKRNVKSDVYKKLITLIAKNIMEEELRRDKPKV